MRAGVDDEIVATGAFHEVLHFGHVGLFHFDGGAAQAVCTSNFLHRFSRDGECAVTGVEKNYLFGAFAAPRLRLIVARDFHRATTGASAAIFATCFSMAAPSSSRPRILFT